MAKQPSGICYLAGAGPGDPALATLKTRALVESAEVLVYDEGVHPEIIEWAPEAAETLPAPAEGCAELLIEKAKAGRRVVRLCVGDPLLFGPGLAEARALREAKVAYEFSPGIPAALVGRPGRLLGRTEAVETVELGLPEALASAGRQPLLGRKVVLAGLRRQAGPLAGALREAGAQVAELPLFRVEPPTELLEFGQIVQEAHTYDWAVFTTPEGVHAFFNLFDKLYHDAREIGGVRIAAVGATTAALLKARHLNVDLLLDAPSAEAAAKAFLKEGTIENQKIVVIRPEHDADTLPRELTRMGAIVDEALAYRTVAQEATAQVARFRSEGADLVVFPSAASVEHFVAQGLTLPAGAKAAALGPAAVRALKTGGLSADLESSRPDPAGVVEAIARFYAKKG